MILISDKNGKEYIYYIDGHTPCTCYSFPAKIITSGSAAATWTTTWLTLQSLLSSFSQAGDPALKLHISICFSEHSWHELLQFGLPVKLTLN